MRRRKSGACWSSIGMMSTREGLLAPAFWAFMVRNLSFTPGVVLAEVCSGVVALADGGEGMPMSYASEEVGPPGSTYRKSVRRPAESRAEWPGSDGGGELGGDCGKGNGARVRGSWRAL